MTKTKTIQLISAVALLVVGACLLIFGFIANPLGEIHNTVLVSFGEILTFVGAIFGVDYSYRYRRSPGPERDIDPEGKEGRSGE